MTSKNKKQELVNILLEKEIITQDQLISAIDIAAQQDPKNRRNLPKILVEDFHVDHDSVYQEVANFYAFKTIQLAQIKLTDEWLAFIRQEFNHLPNHIKELAIENKILPFNVDEYKPGVLQLITPDPTSRYLPLIGRMSRYARYEVCYVRTSEWEEIWKRVALSQSSYQKDKDSKTLTEVEELEEEEEYEQSLEDEINRSGLVTLVENILMDGVRLGASDIHIIPRGEKRTEFHFRIDGKLKLWYTNSNTRVEAVAAVVKDRAKGLDRFERNMAQDGFAQMLIDKKAIRFRVSVIPVVGKELRSRFESIVIRILPEPNLNIRIDDLGFEPYADSSLRKALAKPHGIIIVTGPTGSGKSTTLVAALRAVMNPALNIITVEDPVEYFIEGGRQVKLNPKLDFEGALRAILRHDPDIVMVGEMRDKITADIAVKLANTGHLTLSTLHTNDAPSAISRLFKMGVEPFLIGYAINLVLAQRLLRRLCRHCRTPVKDFDPELMKRLGLNSEDLKDTVVYEPVGCSECIGGYKGRIAIHEALYFKKNIRQLIMKSETMVDEEAIRNIAIQNGMKTLRQSGLELLKKGISSIEEVVSVTSEEE